MAQERAKVHVNQFLGGINTEANPLNFPTNASSDEQNMSINRDGSRSRRLGFTPENGFTTIDTGIAENPTSNIGRSQFRWVGPGGYSGEEFIVVQVGNYLAIHTLNSNSISGGKIFEKTYSADLYSSIFSYASVDGLLIVVNGRGDITRLDYDGTSIVEESFRLKVRDFWGVETNINGVELTDPGNIQTRPTKTNNSHLYNLRNQTFALQRTTGNADTVDTIDPINLFNASSGSTEFPSNADSIIPFVFADANLSSNRTIERYFANDHYKTTPPSTPAPRGYFIIDALNRGASRVEEEQKLRDNNSSLSLAVTNLRDDITPGGATIAESYAGRVWYAGFSGSVTNGDSRSPKLSNYVFFSRTVESAKDVGQCYQDADPTSIEDPNLVDTDGGYIKINGAYNIRSLVALGTSMFVIADNGVWRISGADGDSFVTTTYSVERLNNDGCISSGSVVLAESSVFYWGASSIYAISRNQSTGDWEVNDLAENSIKTLYVNISSDQKATVQSYYDDPNNSVRWVYSDNPLEGSDVNELILNLKFGAFTRNFINVADSEVLGVSSTSGGQPVGLSDIVSNVEVNSVQVTVNGENVTLLTDPLSRSAESSYYCIILGKTPTITYTFGGFSDESFTDWFGLGNVDTEAYINSGFITLGEPRTRKSVPYLTTFFNRTESTEQEEDNSSCILRSQWDWTDSFESYKWSTPRQAYRPQSRNNGQTVVVTRNKVRGHGKSMAFRVESEPGKNLHIYGWSLNVQANREE